MAACGVARAAPALPVRVTYPLHLGAYDARYDYDWLVLRTALEKTVTSHGAFELRQFSEAMSPQRVAQELALPHGHINVMARAASPEFERDFLAIRIPIDKGLLGYRVLLVRKDDFPRFAQVRNLHDLRKLRAGMGKGWADVAILAQAGLPVVEGSAHENLYAMLMANRFDYFARGVDEAQWELKEYGARYPRMAIEPTLLLRYPLPRYLFVRRDAEGELLARRLKAGLEAMVQDGTLDALFRQHKGPVIEPLHLDKRRLLALPNPGLPDLPLQRPELWYSPNGRT
jgi:ABC-type amino acid transport substrate-binding protein